MPWHTTRDAGTAVHYRGYCPPCPLKEGAQVPLHNSIIRNFMIYQDRLERNLLRTHKIQNGFL